MFNIGSLTLFFLSLSFSLFADLNWSGKIIGPDQLGNEEVYYSTKTYEFMSTDNTIICMKFRYRYNKQLGSYPMKIFLKNPKLSFDNYVASEPVHKKIKKTISGYPYNTNLGFTYEIGVDHRTSDNTIYYDLVNHGIVPEYEINQKGERVLFEFKSLDKQSFSGNYISIKTGPIKVSSQVHKKGKESIAESTYSFIDNTEEAKNPVLPIRTPEIDVTKVELIWGAGNIYDKEDESTAPPLPKGYPEAYKE
jgi:hypothetical protein